MSVEAISWVLNDAPDVPATCLAVLIGLANHAHANGRAAYPSQERLAHYTRKSVRSVQRDLNELERLGLIRRGDPRHTAFLPSDRRPVVWDLAMERHRPVPVSLDLHAEARSGQPADIPEPVDNRGVAGVAPVSTGATYTTERGDAGVATTRRTRRTNRPLTVKNHKRPRAQEGAALSTAREQQCSRHRGNPARNCGLCRSEWIGVPGEQPPGIRRRLEPTSARETPDDAG